MSTRENVFLVGPMGSGKSAVGRQLARRLRLTFIDADAEIENRTGVDIAYIFEREGEEGFRAREKDLLDELSQRSGSFHSGFIFMIACWTVASLLVLLCPRERAS